MWGTTGRRMKNTRWLCVVSVALNVAEAKVVAASLYGPLPPTISPRSSSTIPTIIFSSSIVPPSSILPSLFSPSCSVLEIPSFLSLLLLVTRSLLKYIYVIFRLCELIKRDIWEQGRMENDPPFFWLLYRRIFLLYLFTWSFWIRLCKEKI